MSYMESCFLTVVKNIFIFWSYFMLSFPFSYNAIYNLPDIIINFLGNYKLLIKEKYNGAT